MRTIRRTTLTFLVVALTLPRMADQLMALYRELLTRDRS